VQLSEPIPEINIAVLGSEGVGKSTFVQRALDISGLPALQATQRPITLEGREYLLRLLEISNDDVEVDDEDDGIMWPDTIDGDKYMPRVDGVLLLYSVKDRPSFDDLPDLLSECNRFLHDGRSIRLAHHAPKSQD
jgi:GTPase SAR1 family protein